MNCCRSRALLCPRSHLPTPAPFGQHRSGSTAAPRASRATRLLHSPAPLVPPESPLAFCCSPVLYGPQSLPPGDRRRRRTALPTNREPVDRVAAGAWAGRSATLYACRAVAAVCHLVGCVRWAVQWRIAMRAMAPPSCSTCFRQFVGGRVSAEAGVREVAAGRGCW